jgi:predicted flavoprotein YhiN
LWIGWLDSLGISFHARQNGMFCRAIQLEEALNNRCDELGLFLRHTFRRASFESSQIAAQYKLRSVLFDFLGKYRGEQHSGRGLDTLQKY